MNFYAFQIFDTKDRVEIGVETDPAAFIAKLGTTLNSIRSSNAKIESIEIGNVKGRDSDAAMNNVRADDWIDGTHCYANCR